MLTQEPDTSDGVDQGKTLKKPEQKSQKSLKQLVRNNFRQYSFSFPRISSVQIRGKTDTIGRGGA